MEQHVITWRGINIEITFRPDVHGLVEHIELSSEQGEPLPMTETGYKSHFTAMGTADAHGGPVPFVLAWLDHEARQSHWGGGQLSLF